MIYSTGRKIILVFIKCQDKPSYNTTRSMPQKHIYILMIDSSIFAVGNCIITDPSTSDHISSLWVGVWLQPKCCE